MFIYALAILHSWQYDVGDYMERDFHEILKKAQVEISFGSTRNHGD